MGHGGSVATSASQAWRIGDSCGAGSGSGRGAVFEIEGSVDQRDVGEGLGEISDQALAVESYSSDKQAEVVAQREKPLEEGPRVVRRPMALRR